MKLRNNTTRGILTSYIKNNSFKIKDSSKAAQKYQINEQCFDNLDSEEASYWFGFILADGSLNKELNEFGVGLQFSDIDHIKKFTEFLCTNKPIKTKYITLNNGKTYKSASISIKNKRIISKLISYGLYPNKSTTLPFPNCIPSNRIDDFMRGYVDGDGSISIDCKRIGFIATPKFIDKFEELYNVKGNRYKYNLMESVVYNHYQSKLIIERLYLNKNIYLERKYQRVIKQLESPKV